LAPAGLATVGRTPDRYGLSLAVGGAEVTPVELAAAYATLARGGVARPAALLTNDRSTKGVDLSPFDGNLPWFRYRYRLIGAAASRNVLRRSSCLAALQCLADPDRTADVWPAAVPLGVAWKTGTSSGHRDAWCAAVTPRRTVVVWLGNADGTGSDALVGQDAAAPLALRILSAVDPGGAGFAPPAGFLTAVAPAVAPPVVPIALVSPADRQEIVRNPDVPADRQRVELRARADGAVWWFVDGAALGSSAASTPAWWDPTVGRHEVRAVDGAGHAAVAHVWVR
jgi:penicillin-binding protein 1C